MRIFIFIIIQFLAFFLGGCSSLNVPSPMPKVDVLVEEPSRMRFYGKGAGAGMMLMSSMGPMGIAVGVAIDEGIGKDIGKVASSEGLDIKSIIDEAMASATKDNSEFDEISALKVQRYGFVTRSGEGDPVAAQLHILAVLTSGKEVVVRYPEDYTEVEVKVQPLNHVREDGVLVVNMFRYVASMAVLRLLAAGP